MKTMKVSRGQHQVLQALTRKDYSALRKHPKLLSESKHLLRAFKNIIRNIEGIPEHASRRKRKTKYKRIITICKKAIDVFED
jgi:hypothetical protein